MFHYIVMFISLWGGQEAFAWNSRLQIDPEVDLPALVQKGGILDPKYERDGDLFVSDASAVLDKDDFDKLYALSQDYDHYVELGMPGVEECHVDSRDDATHELVIWTHMREAGQDSQHFLEVQLHDWLRPGKGLRAAGMEWQRITGVKSKYPEDSAFKTLDGSWYQEELPGGKVYVRYYLAARLDTRIPPFLVGWFMESHMTDGVRQVIEALARGAAVRH